VNLKIISALITYTILEAAHAQMPSLDGSWSGTMEGLNGTNLQTEVAISQGGGTIKIRPPAGLSGRNNMCMNKEFPLSVIQVENALPTIQVQGAKVMAGCIDAAIKVTSIEEQELKASFPDGRSIVLRKR
jgi:hypothetical protein